MNFVIDQFGRRRQPRPDEVLADGERLIVPMNVMDANPRLRDGSGDQTCGQPDYIASDDSGGRSKLDEAYEVAHARLTNAWRGDQQSQKKDQHADSIEQYENQLRNAWKNQ